MLNKILLALSVVISVSCVPAYSQVVGEDGCPQFTDQQNHLLRVAYVYGNQPNEELYDVIGDTIGYTLASIIWKESFVGSHVIRFNTGDGEHGSYGVGHVQLSTLLWMDGHSDTWYVRDKIAPELITRLLSDDNYAIYTAYRYLSQKMIERGFWQGVAAYNGSGSVAQEYAEDVQSRVNTLIRCGV